MNTVSRLGSETDRSDEVEPAALRRQDDPRDQPVAALDVQLEPAVDVAGPGDALDVAGQQLGEPGRCRRSPSP